MQPNYKASLAFYAIFKAFAAFQVMLLYNSLQMLIYIARIYIT
jgi:hypothetical protein